MNMKRNIYLILALLFMGVVQVRAQQMAVVTLEGTTEHAEYPYEKAKITFSDGQMLFHYDGKVTNTYNIKDIKQIFFYITGAVDSMPNANAITYSSLREELNVNAAPGTAITIYSTCGTRVLSKVQSVAAPAISVAHLQSGTYIVVVGSETLKFVKR